MDNSSGLRLLDAETSLHLDGDTAIFKRTQDIGNHFLSDLATKRLDTAHERMGDFHHVASIPTVVVEKWMAEGFNIFDNNVSGVEIIKRLQSEDMTGLLATSKRIF
jgi:hypothetical protein